MSDAPRHWVGTVSREHVRIGVRGGFAMLNHGKEAPLRRLSPGDTLIYYSPKTAMDGEPLKAFTALGTVADRAPYQAEMTPGTTGWRRDVHWIAGATETPIAPLTGTLAFTKGNWGMLARRGFFEISPDDAAIIRNAMTKGTAP